MILAHIYGVPVEEMAPYLYGAGGAWVAVRAMLGRRRARGRAAKVT